MSMDDSTVTIEIDGKSVDLVATLEAAIAFSRGFGGIGKLYERVKDVDIDAIVTVVKIGMGDAADDFDDVGEAVFRSGPVNLMPKLAEYVLLVGYGGVRKGTPSTSKPKRGGKAKTTDTTTGN